LILSVISRSSSKGRCHMLRPKIRPVAPDATQMRVFCQRTLAPMRLPPEKRAMLLPAEATTFFTASR
jgi:hypothetical protein